jgi:pimeloyl-ACP methyl ester carboxylesterase
MKIGAEYPDLGRAIIMLDPMLRGRVAVTANQPKDAPKPQNQVQPVAQNGKSNDRLSVSMFGDPETLVKQNNYSFADLVATGHRQFPLWSDLDIQYWALSKKQYHGPYGKEGSQAMSGVMNTGNSLAEIKVPALILKADASPEVRKSDDEAAAVMAKGKLVHIDGAAHNLHHDKLERTTQVLNEFLSGLK